MKRNIPKSKKQPARKAWLSGIMSFSLAFCFAMNSHSLEAQELRISAIEADDNGLIKILVEGPAGDYVLESTNDLRSEINWGDLFRKGLPGAQTEITDPFSQTSLGKFYRVTVFPAADGFHINGEFAQELEGGVSFTDLQTAFGLTFPDTDAVIPPVSNLSGAARNARVYAATIASLSKIAQTIRDSFELGSQPSTAEISADWQ